MPAMPLDSIQYLPSAISDLKQSLSNSVQFPLVSKVSTPSGSPSIRAGSPSIGTCVGVGVGTGVFVGGGTAVGASVGTSVGSSGGGATAVSVALTLASTWA